MAKSMVIVAVFGAGAAAGLLVGLAIGGSDGAAEAARAERDQAAKLSAEAQERVRELESELRDRVPRARVEKQSPAAATGSEPSGAAAVPVEPSELAATDVPAEVSAAERASRVATLRSEMPLWLERGEGETAVAALRELAAIVPEGRQAAMELALLINSDVNGVGKLNLSDVQFYGGLGDPAVKALMDWALPRTETPSGFRVMAAYSLPWIQAPSKTLEQFGAALATETSVDVQSALVANLGRLKSPESERLLAELLADKDRSGALRSQAAGALAMVSDEGIVRDLEIVAAKDEDPEVRAAARVALVTRRPPASGYLITGTLPDSQASAAGVQAGDVLVTYGGRSTLSVEALREAAEEAGGAETVSIVVVRGGEQVTLEVRPGRLGVFGRAVEAAEK